MIRKAKRTMLAVILMEFVLSLGFIIAAIVMYNIYFNASDDYVETTATIIVTDDFDDITVIQYRPLGTDQDVVVELHSYYSSDYEGKEILIKYNVNDYDRVREKRVSTLLSIIFSIIGISLFIPACVLTCIGIINKRKKEFYYRNGKKQVAKVTSIKTVYSMSVGENHPQRIECTIKNGKTISTFAFPNQYCNVDEGIVVDVYKHPSKDKYFIDANSLRKAENEEDELELEDINDLSNYNF